MEDLFVKLCPDTLSNILFRLPEKDLMRAKCVSKSLHDFISDVFVPRLSKNAYICGVHFRRIARAWEISPGEPLDWGSSFDEWLLVLKDVVGNIDLHTVGYASMTSGGEDYGGRMISQEEDNNLYADLLPFEHKDCVKYFMDSCNGLLLLADGIPVSQYYVCNPATRQCVSLPRACSQHPHGSSAPGLVSYVAPSLAFDPSVSSDYRIVQFGYPDSESSQLEMDIFSSGSGRWSQHLLAIDMPLERFRFSRQSVFWNGVLYKISLSRKVVMFDLEGPSIDMIDAPDSAETDGKTGCIGLSMGRLSYSKKQGKTIKFWVLHEDQWVLKHTVDTKWLRLVIAALGGTVWQQLWIAPCGIHPNADAVFVGTACMLFCYDFGTERLQLLYTVRNSEFLSGLYHPVYPYHRCLVTLKRMSNGGQHEERAR